MTISVKYIVKIGDKFGRLTVVGDCIKKNGVRFYPCKCDCGNLTILYKSVYVLVENKGGNYGCGCGRWDGTLAVEGLKKCSRCRKTKPIDNYCEDNSSKDRLHCSCKTCTKFYDYNRKYGISEEEYNLLIIKQNNKCYICHKENIELHLDHNHKTKRTRALLCNGCNCAIGAFQESIDILQQAIIYLENNDKTMS